MRLPSLSRDILIKDSSQVVLKRSPDHLSNFDVDVDKLEFFKFAQEKTKVQRKREKALQIKEKELKKEISQKIQKG